MSVAESFFDKTADGKDVYEYTLKNACGTEVHVITYGLRIHKLLTSDKDGKLGDVVLGHDNIEGYSTDYQGAVIGRYANRINQGEFSLDGTTYKLNKNDGNNSLHGGPGGFHQVLWDVAEINNCDEPSVVFKHTSPDGDENFPGTLDIKVTYSLSADNALKITYEASGDRKTPFNPTNHAFFNLSGDHSRNVFDTVLKINASSYTPVNDELIPTGLISPVADTPLDFTKEKSLGIDMFADEHSISLNGGFDHNFCVDGQGLRLHAEAYDPESGRIMQVYSDMPGIQLYTFNKAPAVTGKNGVIATNHSAFCLETQFYPDSMNHENFPFTYVEAGVPFKSETVYKFSVK